MFRNLVETNRCAVVIDGYYEWKQNVVGAQNKSGAVPYFINLKSSLMVLAALKMEGKVILMTQQSIEGLADIHHRMPVFLDSKTIGPWLDEKVSFLDCEMVIQKSKIPE